MATKSIREGLDGASVPDSYLSSDANTTNFGSTSTLQIGHSTGIPETTRIVLEFDLSVIPTGGIVTSASLDLNCTVADLGVSASKVRRGTGQSINWVESEVTWDDAASGTAWDTAGGDFTSTDEVDWNLPSSTGAFSITGLATLVKDAIDNRSDRLIIFLMRAVETTHATAAITSGEGTTEADRPTLEVTYHIAVSRRRIEGY